MTNLSNLYTINNRQYNIKVAKILGVNTSIYISLLLDLCLLKEKKEVSLSYETIYNLTGITEETSKKIEENLKNLNVLKTSKVPNSSKLKYELNEILISKLIGNNEDTKTIFKELKSITKKTTTQTKKPSKSEVITNNLINNIKTKDKESLSNLSKWVSGCMKKFGYMSKESVVYMEEQLEKKSDSDITKLQQLTSVAVRTLYKDPKWVIKTFEEETNKKSSLILNEVKDEETQANISQLENYNGEVF